MIELTSAQLTVDQRLDRPPASFPPPGGGEAVGAGGARFSLSCGASVASQHLCRACLSCFSSLAWCTLEVLEGDQILWALFGRVGALRWVGSDCGLGERASFLADWLVAIED